MGLFCDARLFCWRQGWGGDRNIGAYCPPRTVQSGTSTCFSEERKAFFTAEFDDIAAFMLMYTFVLSTSAQKRLVRRELIRLFVTRREAVLYRAEFFFSSAYFVFLFRVFSWRALSVSFFTR